MKIKTFYSIILITVLLLYGCQTFQFNSLADINPPKDQGNGWWNTTNTGDWVVNSTNNILINKNIFVSRSLKLESGGSLTFQNCTVIVNGNITVGYNSSLYLVNSTLKFHAIKNGSSIFGVEPGGSLYISDYDNNPATTQDRTNITSNRTDNEHRFIFSISKFSNFSMVNSELHQCGFSESPYFFGLYIKADNCNIENNLISNNYAGLIIESSNNTIKDNNIENNDQLGLLIIIGENNTLKNNLIKENKYNFGLLLDQLGQRSNISTDNRLDGISISYLDSQYDLDIDGNCNNYSFLGLVNCTNISISNQDLKKNFNSIFLFKTNESQIINTNVTENYQGIFTKDVYNFSFINCTILNNDFIGLEFIDGCFAFRLINCTIENNLEGMRVKNSNITLINSTINENLDTDLYLLGNSFITAINCTINRTGIKLGSSNANFLAKYFLNVKTMNHTGIPIGNVTLNIYDGLNNSIFNGCSNSRGELNWLQCTGYILSKAGLNDKMAKYIIRVNYDGVEFVQFGTMNKSRTVVIYLNHAPLIVNPPAKKYYVLEDSEFKYDFEHFDKDSDTVYWNYSTNAKWLKPINFTNGQISGTPKNQDIGSYFLNVTCNDNYSGSCYYNFTIIVNNTNDKPVIISKLGCENAYEDKQYIHDFNVTDPDKFDSHTWFMKTNADWLFPIHKTLGRIFGFPYQKHVGSYFVNITCKDLVGAEDFFNFTLVVYPTNDPPTIKNTSNNIFTVKEDSEFYYDFEYSDPDGDSVTWYCHTNATWLNNINASTGELMGMPKNPDVGRFFVNVSCCDLGLAIAFFNFTIQVQNTNDPPLFIDDYPDEFYATEDENFEITFRISDPDRKDNFNFFIITEFLNTSRVTNLSKDTINYNKVSLNQNQTWLKLESKQDTRSCRLFGVPDNDAVGKLNVSLSVVDSGGEEDSIKFTIIIRNVNDPPKIINPEGKYVYVLEDDEYYYDFDFIDIDGDIVKWEISTNANWLNDIIETTGEILGTPLQEHVGFEFFIEIRCIDPYGGMDSQNYSLKVNNTNDAPIILNPCPIKVYTDEDESYEYDFDSIDYDSKNVFWSSHTNAYWLNKIHLFTGVISGIPSNSDVGEFFVNISCRDDKLFYTYWNYTLIVNNTPDNPIIINSYIAPISVNVDEKYYFKFKGIDPDGDEFIWSMTSNATAWLEFNNETGELSGTPMRFDIGKYLVSIKCKDITGLSDIFEFNIIVKGIFNRPPELLQGHVEPKNGFNKTMFTFFVNYQDPDNDEPYIVLLKIDEIPYRMERMSGDNFSKGVVYRFSIKLSMGNHTYYFQALDQLLRNAEVHDFTPTFEKPGLITVSQDQEGAGEYEELDLLWYIVILLIVVELVIGIFFMNRRRISKKRKHEQIFETEPIKSISDKKPTEEPELVEEGEFVKVSKKHKKGKKGKIKKTSKIITDEIDKNGKRAKKEEIEKEKEVKGEKEKNEVEEEIEPEIKELEPKDTGEHILMICPECGEFVNETNASCPGCGVRFIFDSDLKSDASESDSEPHDLLVCPECGEYVNETNTNCPGCGVKFIFDE